MTETKAITLTDGRDLILKCTIRAPREKVFQAWTDPELLKQWFTPAPWTTSHAETDVRPGGSTLIVMRGPDGTDVSNRGVYLDVIENERIVFTNAYTSAWELSDKPFVTVILPCEDMGGDTNYPALVRHWSIADREAHEKMGFHTGWPAAT